MGANVTTFSGKIIQIVTNATFDTDWLWDTELSEHSHMNGILISSIQFNPTAVSDTMIVHDGGIDGPAIFNVKCTADTDQRIKYFNPPLHCRPVIDASDCTATSATILIELY